MAFLHSSLTIDKSKIHGRGNAKSIANIKSARKLLIVTIDARKNHHVFIETTFSMILFLLTADPWGDGEHSARKSDVTKSVNNYSQI